MREEAKNVILLMIFQTAETKTSAHRERDKCQILHSIKKISLFLKTLIRRPTQVATRNSQVNAPPPTSDTSQQATGTFTTFCNINIIVNRHGLN